MLTLLVILAVAAILFGAAVVATQDAPVLADAPPDRPRAELPPSPLSAADLRAVRFGMVLRGYRMSEVDAVLTQVGAELAARDARIADLEQALADVVEQAVDQAVEQADDQAVEQVGPPVDLRTEPGVEPSALSRALSPAERPTWQPAAPPAQTAESSAQHTPEPEPQAPREVSPAATFALPTWHPAPPEHAEPEPVEAEREAQRPPESPQDEPAPAEADPGAEPPRRASDVPDLGFPEVPAPERADSDDPRP